MISLTVNMQKGFAQLIYYSDSGGQLFTVDISTGGCDVNLLGSITYNGSALVPTDIAFHPNGNLYGTANGNLFSINVSSFEATYIGNHNSPPGDFINSLVCDSDGVMYAADTKLFTINILTGEATAIGDLPCESAGDLAFNSNNLYLACVGNSLLKIDLNNPPASQIVGQMTASDPFFGIVTFATECSDVQTFGTAGNGLYEITIENANTQLLCNLTGTNEVYGAAMETDFIASDCEIVLDLDTDNSSGAMGVDFFADLICGNTETMVADEDFSITSTVPDLLIDSIVFEITAGLLDGASEQLNLAQAGTEYDVFGSGTNRVSAVNTAGVVDAGAAHALENLRYINTANPYSPGVREVSVIIYANDDISSGVAVAFITLVAPESISIEIGADTVLCEGETLILDASYENATFEWSDGSMEPTLEVAGTGLYTVTVTNDCGSTATDDIFVEFMPAEDILDLGPDLILCPGESATLDATLTDGQTYTWNTGSMEPILEITETGFYSVSVEAGCGTQTGNVFIEVQDVLGYDLFPEDTTLCAGADFLLNASLLNALAYNWQNGSTDSILNVNSSGIYSVTVSFQCGDYIDDIEVNLNDYDLNVDLGVDTVFCFGDSLELNAYSPFATGYLWDDGSTGETFSVLTAGNYGVTITDGCTEASDQIYLDMESCCEVFVPNVFSPNYDGTNDDFEAFSNCNFPDFNLKIFNRWGAVVYETIDQRIGWNGEFNGKEAQQGVYVWVLQYNDGLQNRMLRGSVTLVR